MPHCRWIALLFCLALAQAVPPAAVAEDAATEAFPDYQPKLTPDTVHDYRPSLRLEVDGLPAADPVNLRELIDLFDRHRAAAAAAPGRWTEGNIPLGGDPQEYEPSDAELMLAEVGDRIAAIAESMHPGAFAAAVGMLGRRLPLEYQRFSFRHVDVMGSGRFFYAGAPVVTLIPAGATVPQAAIDVAALEAMAPERRALYLAGVADGMGFAAQWPADRLRLMADCLRGFTGEELAANMAQFRAAQPSPGPADADPAPVALSLAMIYACQLQWPAPSEP